MSFNRITKRILAFAGAAALSLSAIPMAHSVYREDTSYTGVADWALREVTAMDHLALIPEELQYADLSTELTREQMCSIAVSTWEQVMGQEVPVPFFAPFDDTDSEAVAKAHWLGIVQGDGNGTFRPDDTLTRLEFICFVGRYLEATDLVLTEDSYADLASYTDAASLPDWAVNAARLSVGLDIVRGSGTTLDTARTTSGQEALAMFYRARNASMEYNPVEDFVDLSPWAAESILRMDQLGLIPESVKANAMTGPITRGELCKMVMSTYKMLMGLSDGDLGIPEDVFSDTDDVDILNAYALGIINGRGNGTFDPDSPISRQDFFTICANFLRAIDYFYIDDIERDLAKFPDGNQVAGYAQHPTKVMLAIGAVQGDDTGALNPNQAIVSQEAVVIFQRIVNFYADWTETYEDPEPYEGVAVARKAMEYEGYEYTYGGTRPSTGFDCSGFVYYVYKQFGYDLKPGAKNQWSMLDRKVSKSELLPGDLVFFSDNGKFSGIFHVGIYIGDGEIIHASSGSDRVKISDLSSSWYTRNYYGAKRVL